MIKHSGFAAASTDNAPTPGKHITSEADDLAAATLFAQGGADVLPANGHAANPAHSVDDTNHFGDKADDAAGHHALLGKLLTTDDTADASDDVHSIDHPHLAAWSPADFTSAAGTGHGLVAETQHASLVDSLNHNDLSGLFDHIDSLADGSAVDGGFSASLGHTSDSSHANPIGLPDVFSDTPDVFSDARSIGGQHGGGGGGGSTTPAAFTTNDGTGVDFHVTYDSSVGKAPAGFTSIVHQVADFFASSFTSSSHITINIDVGYGEVDNMRMGPGALGESVTNLLLVSGSQLANTFSSTSYLSDVQLGSGPATGNLYVSFAEGKALGYSVPNTIDGYVGFSSQNGIFDYNNSDGVSSGQYDFFGVVAHEFSEVMGRILLVGASINNTASYMAYDLFHYSSPGLQDFSGNGGYFSTNSGTTNLAFFNNASNGGDAGDWASSGTGTSSNGSPYDACNAFASAGHIAPVTNIDLWTLHAVGFDLAHPVTV